MKTVNKIYLSAVAVGVCILIAFAGLGFMEPWASVYTAYGWPYWLALMSFVGMLIFIPVINYITHKVITIKYGARKITTSLRISGFFIRYVFVILGVLMFAIVIEDYLSLYFAELFLQNNHYLAPNGSVVWSAAGDLGAWLGLGDLAYVSITPDFRLPFMYFIFIVIGLILIALAVLVPRFWYRPVTRTTTSKI